MKRIIILIASIIAAAAAASAQTAAISTNAVDCANFGTLNAEASAALSQHWTLNAAFRYNPWTFGSGDGVMQNRTRTVSAGARYWLWNVYSGWWFGARAQWEEYNRGGILSRETEEGDAYGAALSAGYSLMLHRSFNLDFGFGMWGGWKQYTTYRCPTCGKITDEGDRWFFTPSDVLISLLFTF